MRTGAGGYGRVLVCGRGFSPALQLFLVILFLLTPNQTAAQQLAGEKAAYLALLERYASGDADGAVRAMLELGPGKAREVGRAVISGLEAVPGTTHAMRRRRLRTLKLELLVHTEAGLRLAVPHEQLLIAKDVVDRLWRLERDFERNGPLRAPGPGGEDLEVTWDDVRLFVRDWYLLVASQLAALGHVTPLTRHIADGLERFKDDPELLLARGSVYEIDAEASVVDRSLLKQLYTPEFVVHWRQRLYDAGDDYRRALDRQPDLAEARLRLGRVRGVLGETSVARNALAEVVNGGADRFLQYLAWLFLAELSEQAGDTASARKEYEQALGVWPRASTPKLALSRICLANGDDSCARSWLARSLSEVSADRTDPWWDYLQGQAWQGDDRLRSFRARGLAT